MKAQRIWHHGLIVIGLLGCTLGNPAPALGQAAYQPQGFKEAAGMWDIVDDEVEDNVTYVDGGTEGSALLRISMPGIGQTEWIFLHGKSMHLRPRGGDWEQVTTQPGMSVRSRKYYDFDTVAVPADRKRLNHYLHKIYKRDESLYAPFLVGQAWGATGASRAEAEQTLDAVDLVFQTLPNTPQIGYVEQQIPAGGLPIAPGSIVWVRLDGGIVGDPPTEGHTLNNPIVLTTWNRGRASVVTEVTTEFGNTGDYTTTSCGGVNGIDAFWKLPPLSASKRVTLHRTGSLDRIELSVRAAAQGTPPGNSQPVQCAHCCSYGRRPALQFNADSNMDYYIVAEIDGTDPSWIELDLRAGDAPSPFMITEALNVDQTESPQGE